MKPLLRSCFAALVLGLAFSVVPARAAGPTPEARTARLDALVGLAPEQKIQVADVFRREEAELQALVPASERPLKSMEARQVSRDRVRALLTPDQQKTYDRTPTGRGGGLTLPTPETKVVRLDETVGLTAEQKNIALVIFQAEFEGLLSLPPADRGANGARFRQAAQNQMHEILTPEQRDRMNGARETAMTQENAERVQLTDLLRASSSLAARVGPVLSVSPTGSSSISEGSDGSRKGTASFRVVGAQSAEVVTVSWEKEPVSGKLRIIRAEAAGGGVISL